MPAAQRKQAIFQRRAPAQARSRATVEVILEASARIIRRDGLAGLTTNRIAEAAGVGVGSLYAYFPDKVGIVVALGRRILEEDEAAIRAALNGEAADVEPERAVIRALIARHRTDPVVRRTVMAQHVGLGLGAEHASRAQTLIGEIAARLSAGGAPSDALQYFVATRAVLGVCRALAEEGAADAFGAAALEDELVGMLRAYAGATRAAADA